MINIGGIYMDKELNHEELTLDRNLISSSHINFLFGAGVNGLAFPQLNGFTDTIDFMKGLLKNSDINFEDAIESLDEENRKKAYKKFYNVSTHLLTPFNK